MKCSISQVERYQINNIPNRTLPKCTIFQVRCPNTIKNVRHLFCFSNYWRLGFNLSANTYLRKCRLGICQMGNAKVVVIIIYWILFQATTQCIRGVIQLIINVMLISELLIWTRIYTMLGQFLVSETSFNPWVSPE